MRRYLFVTIICLLVISVGASIALAGEQKKGKKKQSAVSNATMQKCKDNPEACVKYDAFGFAHFAMEIYNQQVADYLSIVEAERIAREQEEASRKSANAQSQSFDMPADCNGKVIPAYIVMRESRCNYGSVNPNGCGGAGCYGMYQIHGMHWNGGGCSDLNWTIPSDQDECAYRLSRGGTNLQPWGG